MKMNEIYEAPMLEVLNVIVESGFAGSDDGNIDAGSGPGGGSGESNPF